MHGFFHGFKHDTASSYSIYGLSPLRIVAPIRVVKPSDSVFQLPAKHRFPARLPVPVEAPSYPRSISLPAGLENPGHPPCGRDGAWLVALLLQPAKATEAVPIPSAITMRMMPMRFT